MESNTCSTLDGRTHVRHTGPVSRTRVRWDRAAVLVAVVVGTLWGAGSALGGAEAGSDPVRRYVVAEGDTLWEIARTLVGPEGDPRPVIDRIREANHLGTAVLIEGQPLLLPVVALVGHAEVIAPDPRPAEVLHQLVERDVRLDLEDQLLLLSPQPPNGASNRSEGHDRQERHGRPGPGNEVRTGPDRHPECGGHPQAGRGGKPAHGEPLSEDDPRAEEADPGDDLGGDAARGHPHVAALAGKLAETARGDQREHAGPQGDQDVGPEARGLVSKLPLEPDQRADHCGTEQPQAQLDVEGHGRIMAPPHLAMPPRRVQDVAPEEGGRAMRCPWCGAPDTRVVDSRPAEDGTAIRRRRQCPSCGRRFTTFERGQGAFVRVIKRDGSK